jgi:hypothetical protein
MLSAHRAFLIKVDTEADPQTERFCGRVEHVVSGAVADFESMATLISFIGRVIGEQTPRPQQGESSAGCADRPHGAWRDGQES